MNIAAFSAKPHLMFLATRTIASYDEIYQMGIVDTFDEREMCLPFNPINDCGMDEFLDAPRFSDCCSDLFYRVLAGRLIVTWGDSDLRAMCNTAHLHSVANPAYASTWIDAMRLFIEHHGGMDYHPVTLDQAARLMEIPRLDHTALGDAKTIRAILEKLG